MSVDFNIAFAKILETAEISDFDINSSLKELYQDKKKQLNLSDRQIQKILGMDAKTINPILDGTAKQVNFINIIKLSHFLGVSIGDLAKIYLPLMDKSAINEIQRAKETGYIIKNFDVSALVKLHFFKKGDSSVEMSNRIMRCFNLTSLYDYSDGQLYPVFSRTKRSSADLIRDFWVRSAFVQFQMLNNPNEYDRKALLELIPKIRPYTKDIKNGLVKVLKALYNVGVTVIYQPSIEKLQVRGATMCVNGKPCIVLSDFQKNYPTLWFTLLHELHHTLFDFHEIQKRTYHISSAEGDLFLMDEEKADNFAREYLLNESRLKYVSAYINSHYNVEKLATEWGVHSSIIYAIYCFENGLWATYNQYIPKMNEALNLLNTSPFDKETLLESVTQIKELIYK